MMDRYLETSGIIIRKENLSVPKARALTDALAEDSIQFATFLECRAHEDTEIVIFEVEVEVPQLLKHDIKSRERIAAFFTKADDNIPEVLSLRQDFPKVPHLNLRDSEFPRSLCLYEEQYRDLKRRWTPPLFVARIRQWFALTAKGKLHQEDQPLEPIIIGSCGRILLPYDLLSPDKDNLPDQLFIRAIDKTFFVAQREKVDGDSPLETVASIHCCPPQQHGIIRRRPFTIAELAEILKESELDLLGELRRNLTQWFDNNLLNEKIYASRLILIILCPKTRVDGGDAESTDTLVFGTGDTLKDVGEKLDLWSPQPQSGNLGHVVFPDTSKQGEDIKIDPFNPCFELTRELAANLNGYQDTGELLITAIGVGALGSQVVMNLARTGFGSWVLVDNDQLMPHNLARHALNNWHLGVPKSRTLSFEANQITRDQDLFKNIPADILSPGSHTGEIEQAWKDSQIILDMSASVAVARHIALNITSEARRVSLFLTPTGNDLVLLAESRDRSIKLDEIEMQYYRAVIEEESLVGHFAPPEGRRRYGQSCRDITSTLPQYFVALHAAIAGRALREVCLSDNAHINIWRADDKGNVNFIEIETSPVICLRSNDWTICTDEKLISKLSKLRMDKLPNETGGVLLGSFDLERRIIYIVDTIPSPPDSQEWPTLYIRGCKGLERIVCNVTKKTDGMLEYIGEWHSHPNSAATTPSTDDIQVFSWLTERMDLDGLPALMMIVGESNRISCFVAKIERTERLLPVKEQ